MKFTEEDRKLMIEALEARIAGNIAANEDMRFRIKELRGDVAGMPVKSAKVLTGKWDGRTKEARAAKAKTGKPKKRKMSAEARKRISDGLKAHRERKAREKAEKEAQNAPQPQEDVKNAPLPMISGDMDYDLAEGAEHTTQTQ